MQKVLQRLGNFDYKQIKNNKYKNNSYLGPYKFKSGVIYEGQFKGGIKQGIGKMIQTNGNFYEGYFDNN